MKFNTAIFILLLALSPAIVTAQNFWREFANTHTIYDINSLIVRDNGFIMASGTFSYEVSKDSGVHWQSQFFPSLGYPLIEPLAGYLLFANNYVYTVVYYNAGDPYAYTLLRFGITDTAWNDVSDYQGDFMAPVQVRLELLTTLGDSLVYYSLNQRSRTLDTTNDTMIIADSEFIYCITPTRTFQPAFIGIVQDSINVMTGDAAGELFAATNTGIFISSDEGDHWALTDSNFSGTIRSFVITPQEIVYAMTDSQRLYRSTNSGISWQFLNDELRGNAVRMISTSNGVIVASADTSWYDGGPLLIRSGVYELMDNGSNWQKINYGVLDTTKIYAIAADSSGYVYAAADSIIYRTAAPLTAVAENTEQIPLTASLEQNFPNPCSAKTEIDFSLPKMENAAIKIYNALGQCVATPVDEKLLAGRHTVTWNANAFPSGVYFYQLKSPSQWEMKTMIIVK